MMISPQQITCSYSTLESLIAVVGAHVIVVPTPSENGLRLGRPARFVILPVRVVTSMTPSSVVIPSPRGRCGSVVRRRRRRSRSASRARHTFGSVSFLAHALVLPLFAVIFHPLPHPVSTVSTVSLSTTMSSEVLLLALRPPIRSSPGHASVITFGLFPSGPGEGKLRPPLLRERRVVKRVVLPRRRKIGSV